MTARSSHMKIVTIYTDGKAGFAALKNVPTRSPLARQPLGDDKQAPSERWDRRIAGRRGAAI